MFNIKIDRLCKIPVYKQIIFEIKTRISTGILEDNYQLPSTRKLSKILGVSRITIYQAYEELIAQGYLFSKEGSYTYVKGSRIDPIKITNKSVLSWDNLISEKSKEFNTDSYHNNIPDNNQSDFIDMKSFYSDKKLYPVDSFRKVFNNTLMKKGSELFTYGNSYGYAPLRSALAKNFINYGINVENQNIIITAGSLNAIKIITELLVSPGDNIVVEAPTFHQVLPIFRAHEAKILDIKMNRQGMDLISLEQTLQHNKTKFIYTMPTFHNPTGITTANDHRNRLLELSKEYKVPIMEDGFDDEMKFFGKVPMSLKTMDVFQTVIYIGTFSKVLFPGLRLGWIVADKKLISLLSNVIKYNYLTLNQPIQAAMAEFIDNGYYDLHLKKVFKAYRKRMKLAIKILKRFFNEPEFYYIEPSGGYHTWIELKNVYIDEKQLNKHFVENGVSVLIGDSCFNKTVKKTCIRISFGQLNEEQIIKGLERVKQTLKKYI